MKVKICGLFRLIDAEIINELLPDYTGLVFYPKSHRFVDDSMAVSLREKINPIVKTVGVFVNDSVEHIADLYNNGIINIIQLHGNENEEYIENLRTLIPNAEIWKAFIIKNEEDLALAQKSSADKIILDNGYGTGRCFDWSLAHNINKEFILAGGITPDNVAKALNQFNLFAIDVSSGVETNGVKDRVKIKAVLDAVKNNLGSDRNV